MKEKLDAHNIHLIFVPAGCTADLQLLDVSFNDFYKREMKSKFIHWYVNEVSGLSDEDLSTPVDLRSSLVKPLHAHWLIANHIEAPQNHKMIVSGFIKSGIIDALDTVPPECADIEPPPSDEDLLADVHDDEP